jgi:hypothetical protein
MVRPANTDPRNERPGVGGTNGRQRPRPLQRREVDLDALAAGFDDTSREMKRPAPALIDPPLPGTVASPGALLQPIQPTSEPTEQTEYVAPDLPELATDNGTSVLARTSVAPTLPADRQRSAPAVEPRWIDPLDGGPQQPDNHLDDIDPSLRAPVVFRRRRRRPRVRRVTRVLRHVDTWSVFKVALVFNLFVYLVCLTAGVLLWQVAYTTGTVNNVERFFEGFGWETFEFKGGEIYHAAWIAGLFVAAGLTGLAVLLATLFNLITDLVGGIRVTVLEEEVLPREERQPQRVASSARRRRRPKRSLAERSAMLDGNQADVDGNLDDVDADVADGGPDER